MTPEALYYLKQGTCPGCSKPHDNRLVSCKECRETLCVYCWMGDKGVCVNCIVDNAKWQEYIENHSYYE